MKRLNIPRLTLTPACATLKTVSCSFQAAYFDSVNLDGEKGVQQMTTKEAPNYSRELVKNYIGGKWVEGSTGKTFESPNPATGEVLARLTISDASDVNKAVETAHTAFKSWRLMPAPRRGE